VASFHDDLVRMLQSALQARSRLFGLEIADEAAKTLSERAAKNIEQRRKAEREQYEDAVLAIHILPLFLRRIRKQTSKRQFYSSSDAGDLIRSLEVDCVYPWCTEEP
jgi:hypothetical protein